ncbi:DUF4268 domain-containing protein [Thalassoglobus sp. JC818]|uniref:DUF4268 domain-containing protein n=1 Tax=Thalassoglobus sp. JC818 TaxID=3232136 RepID=UPI0034578222
MPLYEMHATQFNAIEQTTFESSKIKERGDLQRLLRAQIDVLVSDTMVIAEEFSNWEDSSRRVDLLAIDRDANLVVIELKRTGDGGHMELQAVRYAAMVSAMTWEQAVEAHRAYRQALGKSAEDAEQTILEFLGWEEPDEENFASDIRIVLASADFSRELTTSVLWLNERGLDIRCLRMVPYKYHDQVLLDIQQVIPLPEAEEYQIRLREKAHQERSARQANTARQERHMKFWAGLLPKANSKLELHRPISPSREHWLISSRFGIQFVYFILSDRGRVELSLQRSVKEENKAIFDELFIHRKQIEEMFGGPLEWKRQDDTNVSRICVQVSGGGIKDESSWDAIQEKMVEVMQAFFSAFEPYLQKYRDGQTPEIRTEPETIST